MKILIIDNYDSFTYNLEQLFGSNFSGELVVKRYDEINPETLDKKEYKALIISPGPGKPKDVTITNEMIKQNINNIPIFGICLGMQCINEIFGGETIKGKYPMHGKTSKIQHKGNEIFLGIPQNTDVARYHSLIVKPSQELLTTAWLDDGTIMSQRHKKYPIWAVQFHPESFLTRYGEKMIQNFLKIVEDFYA